MTHDSYDDAYIAEILRTVRTVAMIGASANTNRPSYFAMKYMLGKGYVVHPVNPGLAGQELLAREVYGALADVPAPVDMVDVFRNSEAALETLTLEDLERCMGGRGCGRGEGEARACWERRGR